MKNQCVFLFNVFLNLLNTNKRLSSIKYYYLKKNHNLGPKTTFLFWLFAFHFKIWFVTLLSYFERI